MKHICRIIKLHVLTACALSQFAICDERSLRNSAIFHHRFMKIVNAVIYIGLIHENVVISSLT